MKNLANLLVGILFGVLLAGCDQLLEPETVFIDELVKTAADYDGDRVRTRGVLIGKLQANSALLLGSLESRENISLIVGYQDLPAEVRDQLSQLVIPLEPYTSSGNIRLWALKFITVTGTFDAKSNTIRAQAIEFVQ